MKDLMLIIAYSLVGISIAAFLMCIIADICKHHKCCKPVVVDEIIRDASRLPLASWNVTCIVEDITPNMQEVVVECRMEEFEVIAVGRTYRGKLSSVYEIELKKHY